MQSHVSGRTLAKNSALNLAGQLIPILIGIIVIPWIVRGLGLDRFGLLSLGWVVLGYFGLFDLGLSRATTKFVAELLSRAPTETQRLRALVWTSFVFHLLLGLVGGAVLAALTPLLVEHVFRIPAGLIAEARTAFFLIAFSVPIVVATAHVRGVLEAGQRFDLVNVVRVPSSALTYLIPVAAIPLGFHLPGIVVLLMLGRLAALITYVILCWRTVPGLSQGFAFDAGLIRPLLTFGGWVTVSNLLTPVLMYADRFLIGAMLGVAIVSYYAAPYEVVIRLWVLPTSLVMTLFPAFSALGAERQEDLSRLYIRALKYLVLLLAPIVAALTVFAREILGLWLGPQFATQSTLAFQILCIGSLVGCLAPISGSLLQGIGRPDVLAKVYLVEVPLNILLVWGLIAGLGISGAALSFAIRTVVETIVLHLLSWRRIRALESRVSLARVSCLALTFLALALLPLFTSAPRRGPALQIVLTAVLVPGLVAVLWRYLLTEQERRLMKSGVSEVFATWRSSTR
jgi:O-antigen/teichoic acid export membrane protein